MGEFIPKYRKNKLILQLYPFGGKVTPGLLKSEISSLTRARLSAL